MNMLKISKNIVILGIISGLAGCSGFTNKKETVEVNQNPNWDYETKNEIRIELSNAANKAADAVERLARIEQQRTEPAPSPIVEAYLPEPLRRNTSIQWSGEAETLVRQIASKIGYEFIVSGKQPPVPVMTDISVENMPVAKVLESIGLQTRPFATVVVFQDYSRIEFRYDLMELN